MEKSVALSSVMVKLKTGIKTLVHLLSEVQKIQQWMGSEGITVRAATPNYYYEVNVIKLKFWFSKINHEHWVARRTGAFKDN